MVILPLACVAVYANALTNPFQFDDISIILTDPRVQEFQLGELLTSNYWRQPNTDRLYRPLVLLSYAANWAVSHQPWTFRAPNLILHAVACVLLFELVRRIYGSLVAALGSGLAFAVHPLHTEPLNTVVGRADLLVTVLMLAAALVYWSDAIAGRGRRRYLPLVGAVLLALALASKENAVTLIGIVALLDWWRVSRGEVPELGHFLRRRLVRCYGPMMLVMVAYLVLRWQCIGMLTGGPEVIDHFDNPIAHPTQGLGPGESAWLARWATPLVTFTKAVRLHVVPDPLCFDYSYAAIDTVRSLDDRRLWAGLGLISFTVLSCAVSWRRRRRVLLAVAISAVTYSIVSNLLLIGTVFGERLLYLPSLGYCMLIGLAADFAYRRPRVDPPARRRPLAIVVAIALPLVGLWYCGLTVRRNREWSSPRELYASAYRVNPQSCKVLAGMAANALGAGDLGLAHKYCREATETAPAYWPAWRTGARAVRLMAEEETDPRQKEVLLDTALQYYEQALHYGAGGDPEAVAGAADLYARKGDYQRAIGMLEQLVVYAPLDARAFNELARMLVTAEPPELRDPQRALTCVKRAMTIRPEVANYVDTYVDVLLALNLRDQALARIREVLTTLPPDSPGVTHFRQRLEALER